MKINCVKCGKRFDPEKHMHICPKCNHYHSQTGVRSEMTKSETDRKFVWHRDSGESKEKAPLIDWKHDGPEIADLDPPTYDRVETETEKTVDTYSLEDIRKMNENSEKSPLAKMHKIGAIAIAILIVITIGAELLSYIGSAGDWGETETEYVDYGDNYTEVEFGEPMEFNDFTVNVTNVGTPEYSSLEVEEGWKLVQINFETESPYTYEDETIWSDVLLNVESDEAYAVYEDDITDNESVMDQMVKDGLVIEAHYSGSYFWIFEVPEEADTAELQIMTYTPENDYYVQDECISMPIDLTAEL